MILNIANDTKQNWTFHYRLRGDGSVPLPGPFALEIASGKQVDIGAGMSDQDIFYIIEQLNRHGAKEASETNHAMGRHMGLLYRIDRPVTSDEIQVGHAQVVDTQERRSADMAVKSAVAYDMTANKSGRAGRRATRMTQVEVEQLVDPRERPTGKEIMFSLGIDAEGTQPIPSVA